MYIDEQKVEQGPIDSQSAEQSAEATEKKSGNTGCDYAALGCVGYFIICAVAAALPPLWPILVGLGIFYLFIRWREHAWLKRADLDELIEAKRAEDERDELIRKGREEREADGEKP